MFKKNGLFFCCFWGQQWYFVKDQVSSSMIKLLYLTLSLFHCVNRGKKFVWDLPAYLFYWYNNGNTFLSLYIFTAHYCFITIILWIWKFKNLKLNQFGQKYVYLMLVKCRIQNMESIRFHSSIIVITLLSIIVSLFY